MTVEEATWKLDGALASEKIPLYRRKQIRAAIRGVVLAAICESVGLPRGTVQIVARQSGKTVTFGRAARVIAEIDRLFPEGDR